MINEEPKTDKQKLYDALSGEYDLGTYEEFERNIGDSVKRRKLYDAASADYDLGDYESYSKRIGPTHKENLDAFNAEFGSLMNDFEERDTAETKMSRAGMSSGIIVPTEGSITGEERKRYQELHKQEEALKKAWYTSDEYLAQKDAEAFQLAQMRKDIDSGRLAYAQAHPMVEGYNPSATRGAEADKELSMYETASRIMDDTIKLHNAPSRYDGANAWQNVRKFGKGAGDTLSDVDFWTMGLTEIADNFGVREVLATVQDKLGNLNDLSEESIENILTPAEKAVLQAWAINAQQQLNRQGDLSRGYQAGQGAAESLGFMAEFMLTGGVGKAAAEGVEQMTKWLAKKTLTSKVVGMADEAAEAVLKNMAEKTASSAVRRYGKNLGLSLAEAAGRTGVMPSAFRNISEKATEIRTDEEGNNYLVGMNNAFASGLADSFIETLSEGGRVGALGELFGDVAGKIPFYKRMVDRLSNSKAGELWGMLQSSGVMNTLRAGGWHGIGEEYLEEWYGNALRTLTGVDKDALKEFATWDNQLITVTSFLPLTIFGGTVSTAQVLSAQRGLDKKAAALRSALIDRGYDEAQADNYIDIMKGASPAEISSLLSPIATTVAGRSEMDARALVKPFMDFAMAVRKWQSFDTKYNYQEQEQRDALQQQMEDTLGKFWQEDETGARRVQRAVNAQGEAVYLLGKQSAADAEAGLPASVPAVTADGRKMFVNPSEYQLEDELDMNTFLGLEVMAEKGNTERARMLEDQERSIQQIRQMSAPGTQINLGTAEAPVIATVAQRHPDGVIVTTPDGMARQLTYEELGNYIGINATPLTDAQLDEQEADALLAEQSQREAELDLEYGYDEDSAVEIAEAEEEIVQSAEAVTELPMDSQGNVDETALWNEDPARWAAWNDEQRQDGGANSVTAITAAMTNLSGQIAEQEAAYAAMPVGTERNDLEKQINANKSRLAQLASLQQGYAAQAEAALQAAAQEQAALSASQAQMTEQQMDEMDAQYEGTYSQTRSLNERARLLQEYLDKIAEPGIPAFVLTSRDYDDKMKAAGCSDYAIMQVRDALYQGGTIEGFMVDGKVFLMVEGIPTIDKGRQKYIHEAQHTITPTTDFVARLLATGISRDTLRKYVRALSGGYFYENKSIGVLADEFISFAIEYAYTNTEFSLDLQRLGVDEEAINFIQTIYNEQQGKYFNLAGRRKGRDAHVSSDRPGSSRENDRDLGQVSSGLLGSQRDRSAENSARGAGDREGGEGAAEPAVDDEINPAFVEAISTDAEDAEWSQAMDDKAFATPPAVDGIEADDVRHSIALEGQMRESTQNYYDKHYKGGKLSKTDQKRVPLNLTHFTQELLDTANAMIEEMRQYMLPYLDMESKGKRFLPAEVYGQSTLFDNASYGKTMENTLICTRTLAYIDFVEEVKKRIGRPLTATESFLASQMLYDIAIDPQCLYCYVSLDRKAYDEFLLRYAQQRDEVIAKWNASDKSEEAKEAIYKEFLDGRKPTAQMKARFESWLLVAEGNDAITLEDLATKARRGQLRMADMPEAWAKASQKYKKLKKEKKLEYAASEEYQNALWGFLASPAGQVADAEAYAQSASWAKKEEDYRSYTGELLKCSADALKGLMGHYGLRFYSFSEYSPAFILENMQMVRDAAARGLKGFAYTKEIDFIRIFAPTGMNINCSVYGRVDSEGNVVPDTKQGADWAQVQELREQYPNVGAVFVATNDSMVEWALNQPWIDVIIPFHIVRTGADIAKFYEWTNYSSMQSDTTDEGKSGYVYPHEHLNDKETFLRITAERGWKPRFEDVKLSDGRSIVEHPNYMRLVNETRRRADETPILTPVFNLEAAKDSFDRFVEKGGYYSGYFVEDGAFEEGIETVVEDIKAGKTAKEVNYGRQDVPIDVAKIMAKRAELERKHRKNPDMLAYAQESLALHEAQQAAEGVRFSATEARELLDAMQAGAEILVPRMLTEEVWKNEIEGRFFTSPIGEVKFGENQYDKNVGKERAREFGMLIPTIERPDLIFEEYDPKEDSERQTKYVFVKTFLDEAGEKHINYASVSVRQEGMEVVTSSHRLRDKQVLNKIEKEQMLWNRFASDSTSSAQGGSTDQSNALSDSKDSENLETPSESARFSARTDEQREALFDKAKAQFGLTNNFKVAGYMLPDGSLLDFSEANDGGDPNQRTLDHREIEGIIMDEGREYDSRWMYLADFMNEGAIRLLPEYAGINLMKAPTKEQRSRLFDFIYKYNGEVILEIADERLNNVAYVEYDRRTSPSRIFRDIDGYFNEGIVPQQDVRFSVRESSMDEMDSLFKEYNNDETLSALYDKVSALAHTMGLKIKFDNPWSNAAGTTVADKVKFNSMFMDSPYQPAEKKAHAILHELIHATTQYAIQAKKAGLLSEDMAEAVSQVESIYNEIKADPAFEGMKGVESVHEMVAELANPEFRAALKEKNLFQQIVDAIKRLLGIETGENALDNLSSTLDYILENFDADAYRKYVDVAQRNEGYIRFSIANENQAIFVSNAARAVEGIKMEKATPAQWLAMIEKNGGLKAGEDKWMGLSDWLKDSDRKTLTKAEVLEFVNEHAIKIEETHYEAYAEEKVADAHAEMERILQDKFNAYREEYYEQNEDEDLYGNPANDYAIERLREEFGDEFPYAIEVTGAGDVYLTFPYEEDEDMRKWSDKLGVEYNPMMPIETIRLGYTTDGLTNKREIALTVPTIESWGTEDMTHFGDAGDGRAVAWIRFGETTAEVSTEESKDAWTEVQDFIGRMREKYGPHYEAWTPSEQKEYSDLVEKFSAFKRKAKVLVIDEIQSKRHQEGREKGYTTKEDVAQRKAAIARAKKATNDLYDYIGELVAKYPGTEYSLERVRENRGRFTEEENNKLTLLIMEHNYAELELEKHRGEGVPDAPFEKNWHELAMKRMLRYAAENGYDYIAWTKGEQQAERYNIGEVVEEISLLGWRTEGKDFLVKLNESDSLYEINTSNDAIIESASSVFGDVSGKPLSDIVGKEMADKMMSMHEDEKLAGEALRVGGEGMKGFYDRMLPAFMNKYGKKWGVKVEDITLPNVEEAGRVMHSVPVTEEMKASVMEGQVMFSAVSSANNKAAGDRLPNYKFEGDIRFSLSKNTRQTISGWLDKREDLPGVVKSAVLDMLDQYNDTALQLAMGKWFAQDAIRLPEDAEKCMQAVASAKKAKIDPLKFSSPMEIIDQYGVIAPKEKPINPDTVPTLKKAKELPDGIVIYDVEDSEESRQNLRRIINTHYGKNSSPWCLLQGDESGNLTEDSAKYWKKYRSYPKQVAFKDGRLLAFSANDSRKRVWWDRKDASHDGIVYTEKIQGDRLGRKQEVEIDVLSGDKTVIDITKTEEKGGFSIFRSWASMDESDVIFYHKHDDVFSPDTEERVVYEKRDGLPHELTSVRSGKNLLSLKDGKIDQCILDGVGVEFDGQDARVLGPDYEAEQFEEYMFRRGKLTSYTKYDSGTTTVVEDRRKLKEIEIPSWVKDAMDNSAARVKEIAERLLSETDYLPDGGGKTRFSAVQDYTPEELAELNEYFPGYSGNNTDIRTSMDSKGSTLTQSQRAFFGNSKAVDKDGNLLVLYHGTPRAGFTEFESGWFTTSKEDAISYSGDRKGRLFDPNEKYEPETLTAGDFPLGYMTFDSEEDRVAFLDRFPYAEEVMSERDYEDARMGAEGEEYDALTEKRNDFKKVWEAYREYERERFVDTTVGDLIANPDAYTEEDLIRAMLEYDSNASLDALDEMTADERKDALVSALINANEEAEGGISDMVVPTRVPRNGEGVKHNDLGNRTYEVYVNIENPYEIDANGRGSEFESGDVYKAVEDALADAQYDGVIIRNWRVGRTQQLGDVVVPKNGSQVKLTSNENPTESEDIRFSAVTEAEEASGTRFSVRTNPAPAKTQEVYKLMRLGEDGKLYPLYIGSAEAIELKTWYDAESPNMGDIENLEVGYAYKIDKNGNVVDKKKFNKTARGSYSALPTVDEVNAATNENSRWVVVTNYSEKGSKKGAKAYYNVGINGSGDSSLFGMRPGWHAGSLPTMRQIGKGPKRNLRDDSFVWVRGYIPADIDYQAEADANPEHDIQTHIPTDGYYLKATNANKKASQADRMGWYIAGAFYADEIISDAEARRVIDEWNKKHPDAKVEYDFPRESGKEYDPARGGLVEPADNTRFSAISTPTDNVVAEGMKFGIQDFARLAGNIFQDMPESFRKEAIEETFKRGWDMQSAIFQTTARLAEKENWDESDKDFAKVIREKVQDAMDESGVVMSRPLTTKEALWMLYRSTGANTDSMLDAAKRSMVAYNLGFDKETLALEDEAREAVRFSAMRDATVNAKASMYNRGAVNVMTRLKESFVDMNASVEELVSAIEERSGKKAKGFENILMALNQQSSKGLAAMESYEMKFLNPMFDEIRKIMNETDFTYEDIVRYVILKHGLERNEKLAQRDARSYYQEIYDDIIDKIRSMSAAQKRTYLTNAQLRDADAKAELARLQAADTSAMSADEKREHKKAVAKAQTAVNEAAEHLERAQKIASMSEKEAEDELQMHFDAIAAQTDSKYNELRKNDYSGITSMFYDQLGVNRSDYATEEEYQEALMDAKRHKYDTLGDVEGAADMEVKIFERAADTKGLWKRINAATKETLRQQYEANMISKEQYDNLRGMFEYYVPLRGFKDNTAEDMYTYYRRPNSTGYTKPILAAEGRKTEAESPFGWIASMAGSAIASNVKNEAKLALYYFVSNRPENGIATVSKTWYVHTPGDVDDNGKRIFRPAYPTFSEDLSTEEAKDKLEQWQEQMRELKDQGLAYESGQKLNLGNAVVNISDANKPEHIVNVKVAGKDYTIIINGNPRAAQAINGDLNIEATAQDYSAVFGPILRWMSSVNTSYNPEFWITNMMRDMAFTWMAVNTKESPEYRRKFGENYRKAFRVIGMVAKNEKGTLGDSYLEKMYKEFVDGGGVTGYTQIKDNETWEKEIEKYLSSNDPESIRSGKVMRGVKNVFHAAHRFGESLEQVSRFAAFLTSREMGKPMAEAVNDAKEITVNFNRKGSGKMISLEEAKHLTGRNGKPLSKFWQWVAVAASSISPLGRRFIMFFNAAIQGLNATYKLYKANPKRMIGWTLAYAAVGAMNAVLHAFMDDDDDYLDMPQYERRNSLMIGGGGVYLKWALPQEARAFYALGDIAVESIMGRNPHQNVAGEIGKVFAELLPINPAEGWKAFLPSIAVPAFELLLNEDYKGDPIYNEMKWLTKEERERTAKWSNAKKGTGKTWVLISQGLNNVTGGDMYDAGLINIQPEKMEHLVQSAFGGTIRTLDKFVTTVIAMIDPEEEWTAKQTPFLNRILTINDERFRNVHVNDVFDFYRAEAERAISLEKKYTKAKDSKALRELRSRDEYKWAKIYARHRKALENINDKLREADGTQEKKELMKRQDELKKKMIKEFSSAR